MRLIVTQLMLLMHSILGRRLCMTVQQSALLSPPLGTFTNEATSQRQTTDLAFFAD